LRAGGVVLIGMILQRTAFILSLALLAACNTAPPDGGRPRGIAHIVYDGSSYDVTDVYYGGDTTGSYGFHMQASFGTLPSSYAIHIRIDSFSHTGRYVCPNTNNGTFLFMSLDMSPLEYYSDSGEILIDRMNMDSAIGSFSARLIGSDSSYHHLNGTFIASSHWPLP